MKSATALVVGALLSAAAIGCGEETTLARVGARSDGVRVLRGDGWSFAVPGDWEQLEATLPIVARVRTRDEGPRFARNVNLVVEPFEGDSRAWARQSIDEIVQAGTLIAERDSMAGGLAAVDVEVRWAAEAPSFRTLQRYVALGGSAVVLTCAMDETEVESRRGECERVLESLRVTAPEAGR